MQTEVSVQIIERHVANHLFQHDIVVVGSVVLGEVIPEYGHFLIRTALTTLDVSESTVAFTPCVTLAS